MTNTDSKDMLRLALAGNGAFSALCGVIAIFAADSLGRFMGDVPAFALIGLGIGLLGFAGVLVMLVRKDILKPGEGLAIIAMDLAWVLGSIALIALAPGWLSSKGLTLIGVLAVIVGGFALFQYMGVRQLSHSQA